VATAGLRKRGDVWHVDTTVNGRRLRRSCETSDRAQALAVLRALQAEYQQRGPLALRAPKVTVDELLDGLVRDYEVNGKRSVGKARKSAARLREFFGGWKAVGVTGGDVRAYVEKRQAARFANASINRELAALKRAFRLGVKGKQIPHDAVPDVPMLKEAPPRAGFFEAEQFQAVLRGLPPDVRPVALFGYETGWRVREIVGLQWRQVDLEGGTVRLDPGSTKNGEGRVAYCSPALLETLRAQRAATVELERKRGRIVPWVFHRRGQRILRFLGAWRAACRGAGVPGMLFHDLRRTAVRNMVRAGVPERVAMQVSGHRTRSVFERYNIVSDGDLREAARKMAAVTGAVAVSAAVGGMTAPLLTRAAGTPTL
jgi:integrase